MVIRRTVDPPTADDDGSGRPDDRATLARVAAGDLRALGVLYDRFAEPVHSLALHVVGDPAVAEGVTREVFLAVRRDAARFDPARGSVATWLLTTARHRAVEARRRAPGTVRHTDGTLPDRAGLSAEQQAVVGLAYFEGFTQVEIARIRDCPADAVLADVAEALTLLRPEADDRKP
ncbi:sigma factor [Actinomycetospora atypica]|uniref:Sigma factor n=1 Tax=Actinomycetospora atypica TaxID=1290095 RepID=A0ABV9YVC4_9PSEU